MRFPQDRGRLVAVLTSVACVVAVVLGATVATSTLAPAVAFASTGHWVVNTAESAVVHVDGGTQQVDARVELPADIGEPLFAVQGERQGFVVAADRIAVFGRSSLTVDSTIPVEFAETPVGIETLGGPYLVYREAGTIVRLGVPPLSLPVGGRVERPVWTDDGTVWLHRPDNGSFCALRNGADELDCSVGAAPGEPGGLSVTGELPAFVGSRQDAAQVIIARLGSPVGLGTDVVDAALLADRDTEGRLAVVEPATNRLVLTDSGGVPDGRDGGAPVVVELGPGTFTSPVAADGIVAVLDTAAPRLHTYDVTGRLIATTDLPPGTDAADLIRGGDGRIYVDDADGSATHIVGADGRVATVGTSGVPTDLVSVAAPPDRRSPVVPPPSTTVKTPGSVLPGPPVPVLGGGPAIPLDGSGGAPIPPPARPIPPGPQPPSPVVPSPIVPIAPPTGVVASNGCDGGVTVSWRPVESPTLVTYTLRGGGQVLTGLDTSMPVRNLPLGVPLTFTVSAANGVSDSGMSASSNVVTPCSQAATPERFTADRTHVGGGGFISFPIRTELTWAAPDLGGGELVSYVVTGSQEGAPLRQQTVTSPRATYEPNDFDPCLRVDFQVRAVTREVGDGSGAPLDGAPASHGFQDSDCTPIALIRPARLTGDRTVTVEYVAGTEAGEDTICTLRFSGVERWTKPCAMESNPEQGSIVIDGLDASTEYSVTLTSVNRYGSTTSDPSIVRTNP